MPPNCDKAERELSIKDHLNFAMKIANESCEDETDVLANIYHQLGKAHEQLENWDLSFEVKTLLLDF